MESAIVAKNLRVTSGQTNLANAMTKQGSFRAIEMQQQQSIIEEEGSQEEREDDSPSQRARTDRVLIPDFHNGN